MGRALVLNASDSPLAVVPARRAVVLVIKDKAEVVLSNGMVFHSERIAMEAPSVGPPADGSCACPTARMLRSRAGRCSLVTDGTASTAAPTPRTSTT